jgi:CTP:molybdopterin cytidylyltransferase MocA
VFHRRYFEFLAKLEGDKGPRELIKRATTYHLSTEPGDIDNKTDLEKFRRWEEAHSV